MEPNMCVDNNGVIHVVWSKRITGQFWKIMYSKSLDNGETWSEDYNISQNDDLWMSQPHIAFDSENNLYVTYDYDTYSPPNMLVYLQIFDGMNWSEPILVTEGMLGSDYNKLIVDDEDKLFIGWYRNSKFYYRFYENNVFSDVYCPFCDSIDIFLPVEFGLSTNNIIKSIGSSASYNYIGARLQYFQSDININVWELPLMLRPDNTNLVGKDIDLKSNDDPQSCFREKTDNPLTYDETLYMSFNNQQWSMPELIVEDPYDQQIAIDQFNRPHIVNREKIPSGWQLIQYRKFNNEWIGNIIDTGYIVQRPNLIFHKNQLIAVYDKTWETGDDFTVEIMFAKYDITTRTIESNENVNQLHIYPNPAKDKIYFEFEIINASFVNMYISSFYGKEVKNLVSSKMTKGKYVISWDGKTETGKKASSGLFLCRLYAGQNVITKSFEIIN